MKRRPGYASTTWVPEPINALTRRCFYRERPRADVPHWLLAPTPGFENLDGDATTLCSIAVEAACGTTSERLSQLVCNRRRPRSTYARRPAHAAPRDTRFRSFGEHR